ncbi:acyl carrier protein (plasmid) [Streptomyces sp. BI20]|uniref:acyl carrier protein n=1 Tax=Streptomyces sp. BI20 TaxID=3403460 RepID=UPI003C76F1AE
MTDDTTREHLLHVLRSVFDVDPAHVTDDTTLERLGLDSLAQVELAECLGEHLRPEVSEDDITGATTFRGLSALVRVPGEEAGA